MNSTRDGDTGWTFFRVIGLIAGMLLMVGFGLCSLVGLAAGGATDAGLLLLIILPSLVIALLGFLLVRRVYRLAHKKGS